MKKGNNNNNNNNKKNQNVAEEEVVQDETSFAIKRTTRNSLKTFYDDESTQANYYNTTPNYKSLTIKTKKVSEVTNILQKAINAGLNSAQKQVLIDTSTRLYMTNPIYADIVHYFSHLFMYRYKVIPHKIYPDKPLDGLTYSDIYREMIEVVDGISIETIFPEILTQLFVAGMVCLTTIVDKKKMCLSTLLLPPTYCRPIGQTQYGMAVIEFDFSYFDKFSALDETQRLQYIAATFSKEFKDGYQNYLSDKKRNRWQILDARFSTAILLNPEGIPYLLYIIAALTNYEKYQDNELARSDNKLKYLVVQTMPHFQTDLIFTVDEVKDLHSSLRKKIEADDNARLITTWGDVHVETFSTSDDAESEVLNNAFKTIFNDAGLNSTIFTADSVEAMKMAILKDKSYVYTLIEAIVNFYTMAVNNGWNWKSYQADIEILPISNYTYNDDIEIFKNNATLGVNKLDYLIASGTKQKNIQDQLTLEDYLGLDKLKPLQTSYTQSGDDESTKSSKSSSSTEIEPSEEEGSQDGDGESGETNPKSKAKE